MFLILLLILLILTLPGVKFSVWCSCCFTLCVVAVLPAAIAPDRRADIANCGIRALIAASVACFMTACIAGELTGWPPLGLDLTPGKTQKT